MSEFQLLEAKTGQVPVPMPWRRDKSLMDMAVTFQQQGASIDPSGGSLTAVIGRNGTGKSHLLNSIVQTFNQLEELAAGKRNKISHLPLQHLAYRIGDSHCVVERSGTAEPNLFVNGKKVEIQHLPMPKRIVAVTTSPFDKFPVPVSSSHSIAPKEFSIYRYLGLRDRTGRAAIENLLFRSLNSLFETSDNEALRRANIGRVFSFLDLIPKLSVIYRFSVTARIMSALRSGQSLLDADVIANTARLKRTQDVIKSGDVTEPDIRKLLRIALENSSGGILRLTADFDNAGSLDELFLKLRPLRRAGFLQLRAVEVTQSNGLVSDLKRASSGQLSMASSLLSLAAEITNGSLVLIDEPELSLHPEWQVKYVGLLLQTFANYYGCHYIIATHSPMVISELPDHATVISLDGGSAPSAEQMAGQSADFLLAEAFGLPTNNNRYVKDRIVGALRMAADGKHRTAEFLNEVGDLQKFATNMEPGSPARVVIDGLQEAVLTSSKTEAP